MSTLIFRTFAITCFLFLSVLDDVKAQNNKSPAILSRSKTMVVDVGYQQFQDETYRVTKVWSDAARERLDEIVFETLDTQEIFFRSIRNSESDYRQMEYHEGKVYRESAYIPKNSTESVPVRPAFPSSMITKIYKKEWHRVRGKLVVLYEDGIPPGFNSEQKLNSAIKSCAAKNWTSPQCNVVEASNEDPKELGWADAALAIALTEQSAKNTLKAYLNPKNYSGFSHLPSTGEKLWRVLTAQARQIADKNKASECQRACIASCITSQFMFFDLDKPANENVYDILESSRGVCRHYSLLGSEIMKSLSLDAEVVAGVRGAAGHAWIKLNLNGEQFYTDPQNSHCEFVKVVY